MTGCAVRGLDLQAGRIAGVVTERGRIRCEAVVLAGGAWSRLFCGNVGIDFPQLTILASVCRTWPLAGAPAITAAGSVFAFRQRRDGGYSIARRNANIVEIGPDHVRLLADFLPQLRTNRHEFRLRIGRQSWVALHTRRRWSLDEATLFEALRVLDPTPRQEVLAEGRSVLARAFPAFARMEVAQSWGGMIDVTPDALPVIDRVAGLPGFFIATGFSGDGFGTGPGAGRLMAEIVTGATPGVDPTPFRLDRFPRTQAPPTG